MSAVYEEPRFKKAIDWFVREKVDRQLSLLRTFFEEREKLGEVANKDEQEHLRVIVAGVRQLLIENTKEEIEKQLIERFAINRATTSYLVTTTDEAIPTPERDITLLRTTLSIEQLQAVIIGIVNLYRTGELGDEKKVIDEISEETVNAARRWVLGNTHTILMGDQNFKRLEEVLMNLDCSKEEIAAFLEPVKQNIDHLRNILLFRYVRGTSETVLALKESLEKAWLEIRSLTEQLKRATRGPSTMQIA